MLGPGLPVLMWDHGRLLLLLLLTNVQRTSRQTAQVGTRGHCGDGTGSVNSASSEFGQGQGAVPHGEWRDRFDDAVLGRSIKLRADGLNRG